MEAAHYAPSAGNIQPWYFYVVKDRDIIKNMQGNVYSQEWIARVPCIIIACTDKVASEYKYGKKGRDEYSIMDTAAAIQNILLCACDLGISTCWIGDINIDRCGAIVNMEKYSPLALITVGYAEGTPVKSHKKDTSEVYEVIGENEISIPIKDIDPPMSFMHCDMGGTVFNDVNLGECSINNANMYKAKIKDVNLSEAEISYCNLSGLKITDCLIDGLIINGKIIGEK